MASRAALTRRSAARRCSSRERSAPLLALVAERALALLELGGQCPRARELRRGPAQRLRGRRALVRHLAGVLPQPLAPQPRFLGAGTACLEQAEQTCVFLVSALDRRLRLLATLFRLRQALARRAQFALRLLEALIGRRGCGAQPLEAMLAPEHARTRVCSTAHAQPVAPDPLALPRHERTSP